VAPSGGVQVQARAVVAEVQRISAALTVHAATHCHTCGLPTRDGRCTECDY
jgi:hypothetical protein